ncbi:hypothetical protein COCNU_02G017200 [Cocos nucifera]|uniref:Uncharacterized protein n=1 Tax=Cocos nucifera TaxID=13894 RepID=A0A8K0I173_COCNU|nr:hypothetical protein COCNU_02G017200 [Cocos nucifera]
MAAAMVATPISTWNGGCNSGSMVPLPSSYLPNSTGSLTQPSAVAGSIMAAPNGNWRSSFNYVSGAPMNLTSIPAIELGKGKDSHVDLFSSDLQSSCLRNYDKSLTQSSVMATSAMAALTKNLDTGSNSGLVIPNTLTSFDLPLVAATPMGDQESGWNINNVVNDLDSISSFDFSRMSDLWSTKVLPNRNEDIDGTSTESIKQQVQAWTSVFVKEPIGNQESGWNSSSMAPTTATRMPHIGLDMGEDDVMDLFTYSSPRSLLQNNLRNLDQPVALLAPNGSQEIVCNGSSMATTTLMSVPATEHNFDEGHSKSITTLELDNNPNFMFAEMLADWKEDISFANTEPIRQQVQASASSSVMRAPAGDHESGRNIGWMAPMALASMPTSEFNVGENDGTNLFPSEDISCTNIQQPRKDPWAKKGCGVVVESNTIDWGLDDLPDCMFMEVSPDRDDDIVNTCTLTEKGSGVEMEMLLQGEDEINCTNIEQSVGDPSTNKGCAMEMVGSSNAANWALDDLPHMVTEVLPHRENSSWTNIDQPRGDVSKEKGSRMEMVGSNTAEKMACDENEKRNLNLRDMDLLEMISFNSFNTRGSMI